MDEPTFEYKNPNHGTNYNEVRGKWCDVTITDNDKEYRAHKVIVATNLKYFKTRLLSSSEDRERDTIIDMKGVNVTDLAAFMSYAYTGKILLKIDNALSLLKDAHQLNEDEIKGACITFLQKHLKSEEACCAYRFALDINNVLLKDAATASIMKNLEVCLQTNDFLDVEFEDLKKILYDTKSGSKTQQVLFEGIVKWIIHDVHSRKDHTDVLLSLIDMSKLTAEYMMNYLENVARRDGLDDTVHKILSSYNTSKRLKNERRTVLIFNDSDGKLVFQRYDLISKKWSSIIRTKSNLDDYDDDSDAGSDDDSDDDIYSDSDDDSYGKSWDDYSCDISVLDDILYYIKEFKLYSFNYTTGKITKITTLNKPAKVTAICACTKFLHVCGSSKKIQRYDLQTDSAEESTCIKLKYNRGTVPIFYQNSIHLLGGKSFKTERDLKAVIKYNPVTSNWSRFPSMCEGRTNPAVAVLDEKLYACGGFNKKSVEVYEPTTKSWRKVRSMNKRRRDFLVVAYEGKLFAIGGDKEKTVEVYDPVKDEWQEDQEASSGLQIRHPKGGLISDKCLRQRALKKLSGSEINHL